MFTLTYTDVGGRTHTKSGDSMEELVRLAARMSRLGLIAEHRIALSEDTVNLRRETRVLWAIPRGEETKWIG